MDIQDFLIRNYQWIIGAIAVPFVLYFLQKNKKAMINFLKMEQRSNKSSTFYQAEKIIIKQAGLSVTDARDIANSIFRENFPKLQAVARAEAKKNVQLFVSELEEKITSQLNAKEINKFQDPDIQYTLYEAIKSNARIGSEELRRNLSVLMVERIKNDDQDLKRIVYNEAISTIGKLTRDQLKILTLCFLLRYTYHTGILDWRVFNYYISKKIKPFTDFKNTPAEFQHLEYAGCGSIGIGRWDFIQGFRENYSFLFLKPLEQSGVDELNLQEDLKSEIVTQKENKYFFRFRNSKELKEYLEKKSVNTTLIDKISNMYQEYIQNEEEVRKKVYEETDGGKDLARAWADSQLEHLSLTSVGIVIGAAYYEQIIEEKIYIDIWIN